MIVPYTSFLSFLMKGINPSYRENLYYIKEALEFQFEQYVLSQMHLGILCHLLKRDLHIMFYVYHWIEENMLISVTDAITVLRWYYQDLYGFFRSISRCKVLSGKKIYITAPLESFTTPGLQAVSVNFHSEKDLIIEALQTGNGDYSQYINFGYKEVIAIDNLFLSE